MNLKGHDIEMETISSEIARHLTEYRVMPPERAWAQGNTAANVAIVQGEVIAQQILKIGGNDPELTCINSRPPNLIAITIIECRLHFYRTPLA